jgi:hypothetical protein
MSTVTSKVDLKRVIDLGYPLHIVSLGPRCYSRSMPERFHIYNYKQNEVRMPFDGCCTPYKGMCEILNNDFFDFETNLIMKEHLILNNKYHITFNHERNTNIDVLKSNLFLRKSCFLKRINKGDFVVFFLVHNKYPSELIDIINLKYPFLKYKIFCLDYNRYLEGVKKECETEYCQYKHIPVPTSTYDVYKNKETPNGLIFEKKVLTAFMGFLEKITNISYDIDTIFSNRSLSLEHN